MATQSFEQLIAGANKIKQNQLPESNTAGIVGEQLIQMVNKQKDEETERMKGITEYNVSVQHPTSGIGGTNKYTLEGAIAKIPAAYRRIGIKCSFVGEDGAVQSYVYKGGRYSEICSWMSGNIVQNTCKVYDIKPVESIYTPIPGLMNGEYYYVQFLISEDVKFAALGISSSGSASGVVLNFVDENTELKRGLYTFRFRKEENAKYVRVYLDSSYTKCSEVTFFRDFPITKEIDRIYNNSHSRYVGCSNPVDIDTENRKIKLISNIFYIKAGDSKNVVQAGEYPYDDTQSSQNAIVISEGRIFVKRYDKIVYDDFIVGELISKSAYSPYLQIRVNGISFQDNIKDNSDKIKAVRTDVDEIIQTNHNFVFNTRGYINIDTAQNQIIVSAPVYVNVKGSKTYTIAAKEYTYNYSGNNFMCLVYIPSSNTLDIVQTTLVRRDMIVLAAMSRESSRISAINYSLIDVRLDGVSTKKDLESIKEKVRVLENNAVDAETVQLASAYIASIKSREQYLRDVYNKSSDKAQHWYGVEWKEEKNAGNVVAINSAGDDGLHTSLPIQSKMRRCVVRNGIVQYYLHNDNSELKSDGTQAKLDGTDGDVMVEIPEFFFRIESENTGGVRTVRIKLSEQGLPGFKYSRQMYTSAYEATVDRTANRLASVCTTTFKRANQDIGIKAADNYTEGSGFSLGQKMTAERTGFTANAIQYRGGTNDSSLDKEISVSSQNYSRNQLGIPVSNVTRDECRQYASKKDGMFCYLYDTQKALYILCLVEYKNRNIQNTALGKGAVTYPSYEAYEAYWNKGVVDSGQNGISCIPCGVTNALGNKSGEIYFRMINVPVKATGSKETAVFTEWGNVWMPCMSYRGVEHFYGHIYKIAEQLNIHQGARKSYVEGHDGDVYYGIYPLTYYYEKNPYLADNKRQDAKCLGTFDVAANICTINSILMGPDGHIVPIGADSKNYDEHYCDCVEITAANTYMYASYNGRLVSNKLVGLNFIFAQKPVDATHDKARPSDGTRLDMIL